MKKFFVKVPLPIAAAVAIGSMGLVTAADWPERLTLHEESRSPDGHYGIVVTTSSHVDDGATVLLPEEGEEFVDYFADLQTHTLRICVCRRPATERRQFHANGHRPPHSQSDRCDD